MRIIIVLLLCFLSFDTGKADAPTESLGKLPVQDSGRVKPFDTFARESLQLIYGRTKYKDKSAVEIVMTWLLLPDHWDGVSFVKVERKDLKEILGLDKEKTHFSPKEILSSEKIMLLVQDLGSKRKNEEKLNPYWQAVQTLESQISVYKGITAGAALKLVPKPDSDAWLDLREVGPEFKEKFEEITKSFVVAIDKKDGTQLTQDVASFMSMAQAQNPAHYPESKLMNIEYWYNDVHPFMWAWILYLSGAIFVAIYMMSDKPVMYKAGLALTLVGFALHTVGFAIRIYITGRPPVSNMYESVIWVSWGALMISFILEYTQKKKIFLIASQLVAVLCLIVADIAPSVLDPSMQPLQAVLRSNMWLTVHVLTITLSYSAFFLAFILGDIGLFYYLKSETKHAAQIQTVAQSIYRTIQVGFVLLFTGTVLGGVWADYSWGRFWGWDPKETWAFIALMGYLAILHGRLAGWLRNFGLVASSVVAFSLVLMAWYGVNYVLGAGLHTYGFGGGGLEYVTGFVFLHIALTISAITVRQSRMKRAA